MKNNKYKKILISILIIMILIMCYISNKNIEEEKDTAIEVFSEQNIDIEDNLELEKADRKEEKEIDSSIEDWNLILVNKDNLIPEGYNVEVDIIENNLEVDIRIKKYLAQMLNDARSKKLDPIICSAYRSTERQKTLFSNKVKYYKNLGYYQTQAEEKASYWVSIPGTSEHEIGLSVDIVSRSYQILDENQEKTNVQKWLMENCHEYGFILRYPTEKKDITKVNYEPWHYRYVGIENAKFMKEKEFCLEEYIDYLKQFEL